MKRSALLAPWEFTGDVPEVLCEGEISFEGALIRFEMIGPNSNRQLVFRMGGDDGSWLTYPAPPSLSPPDVRYAGEHVLRAVREGSFRRHFIFDFGQVQLLPDGTGYWPSHESWSHYYTFSTHQSLFGMESSQTRDFLLGLLDDTTSEASFALRFSQASHQQKRQIIFGFENQEQLREARTQMDHLCRLVLCSDVKLWKQESHIYWGLNVADSSRPTRFWLRSFTSSKKLTDPYLQRWADILGQFGPLIIRSADTCLREYLRQDPLLASGESVAPTFHEQLEARFALRDWGRTHLPPDVWDEVGRLSS